MKDCWSRLTVSNEEVRCGIVAERFRREGLGHQFLIFIHLMNDPDLTAFLGR